MKYQTTLQKILSDDPVRMRLLYAVQALKLNDSWIGAGFVRDAVWDHIHGYGLSPIFGDVDVVWFDSEHCSPDHDRHLEDTLRQQLPSFDWSVKNQARMHQRNGDYPYTSTRNALLHWPETATAIAVRLGKEGLDIIAPYGLSDLFELRLRPTPGFERVSWVLLNNESQQSNGWNATPGYNSSFPYKLNIQIPQLLRFDCMIDTSHLI